jgi:hypothetical protein
MALRIPNNQIKENLYTSGNEFIEKVSYKEYKGYYCAAGNKFFSGKNYNPNAIEIVKSTPSTNKVKGFNVNTLKYFYQAPKSIQNILTDQTEVRGIKFTPSQEAINRGYAARYFVKKTNVSPINITEVSEETFTNLKNPIYTKASLLWKVNTGFNQSEIEFLDKSSMSGIKTFLQDLNYNPEADLD